LLSLIKEFTEGAHASAVSHRIGPVTRPSSSDFR
jgi:hypothetical protein